jgi:hypothetical protein
MRRLNFAQSILVLLIHAFAKVDLAMTLFVLSPASSRGAGKRQVETKFRISKSKGRSLVTAVTIGDSGDCHVDLRGNSRELVGYFSADVRLELIDTKGNVLHSVVTPRVGTMSFFGLRLRGRMTHAFQVDPQIISKTDKLRVTCGGDTGRMEPEPVSE